MLNFSHFSISCNLSQEKFIVILRVLKTQHTKVNLQILGTVLAQCAMQCHSSAITLNFSYFQFPIFWLIPNSCVLYEHNIMECHYVTAFMNCSYSINLLSFLQKKTFIEAHVDVVPVWHTLIKWWCSSLMSYSPIQVVFLQHQYQFSNGVNIFVPITGTSSPWESKIGSNCRFSRADEVHFLILMLKKDNMNWIL